MKEKCYLCEKGTLEKKKVDYKLYGTPLGRFNAEVCDRCGEIFYEEEESAKMTKAAKEKGLWGLEAHTRIGRSGDGLVIRVNKKLVEFLNLKEGEEITLIPESKERLVVEI